ncbi:hypothetical protein FSP39_000388 [Pinctada imbricata]|uniref:Mediator of RNA polymerase II transcription subunit 24 n=1 Tax=Pinctada imbricata TaxID=66713 RepID=A0AA88Y1J7_PINIB|nr:hypothetical protein FSP39_000388 [Pinctada imbricata]
METKSSNRAPTTFAGKVKNLLMKAWRERWNENHWGVQLKKVLMCSDAEAKELPDILMNQAFVGPNPNTLILGYVKHIVQSQMVPPSSVFNLIDKYTDMARPYCILGLIDLVETFGTKLSFTSGLDSSVTLCKCLQNTLHWLMLCVLQALQTLKDMRQQQEYTSVIDAACMATQKITENITVQSLLYIAMSEDIDKYRDYEQTVVNVRGTLTSQVVSDTLPELSKRKVEAALQSLLKVHDLGLSSQAIFDVTDMSICHTVNAMIAMEAVLCPTNDIQPFVEQIRVTERLLKLSRPYLFCEMLRACFMGLINVKDGPEELKWTAFTFLKLPQALIKLSLQAPGQDFGRELEQGFEILLNSVPLLDLLDSKLNCDNIKIFLLECNKYDLLTKSQIQALMQRRSKEAGQRMESSNPTPTLIIRAEPTLVNILKSLDADIAKNQDTLMGVLCQMLSGKSFELVLAAAAANGKLPIFVSKLVKINEFAKQSQAEAGKAAQTRALLFDISFIMMCYITQLHGIEIVTCNPECMDSFFVTWALQCLPEDGKYKCTDNFPPSDQNKVDTLLSQLLAGSDIKLQLTRWNEICSIFPHVTQDILFAWEHNALSTENVQVLLELSKSKMCSIPVIMVTWLCSYMNTVGEEAREKPIQILQILQNKVLKPEGDVYYNERYHLMVNVMRKLSNDILPPNLRDNSSLLIPTSKLPGFTMSKCLQSIFHKGWVDSHNLHILEQLLNLCGSDWFCEKAIKEMLVSNRVEDLTKALSLTYSIFHMDIEHIALSLMFHMLPKFLQTPHYSQLLTDPKGYTLAKLSVAIITAAQTARTTEKDSIPHLRRGRKRSRKEVDLEEMDETECRPVKRSKSSSLEPQLTLDSEGFNFAEFLYTRDDGESSPTFDTKDPLNKALANLMRLMNAVCQEQKLCPRISFIISFINEALKCGSQYSRYILQFMPPQMVSTVMKSVPGVFDNQQILHICDLTTSTGRKVAAKAVCQNSKLRKIIY